MTVPIGPGAFVAVVGASGVGKDALLSYARRGRRSAGARHPRRDALPDQPLSHPPAF